MTQKDRLIKSVGMINSSTLSAAKHKISVTLAEAQNRPPEGRADGSLNEDLWSRFRSVESGLEVLLLELRKLNNELNGS